MAQKSLILMKHSQGFFVTDCGRKAEFLLEAYTALQIVRKPAGPN
jgi:hypothetical protein